jgi:hypothetical protein
MTTKHGMQEGTCAIPKFSNHFEFPFIFFPFATHVAIILIMLRIWAKPKNETLSFPNFANNFNDSTN